MAEQSSVVAGPDRRERFRAFMKRFNPTAPPRVAVAEGLICQFPGRSVFNKLAAGADLTPGSQQLLTGGIGSGKTTELLMAERELLSNPRTQPVYVDVSAETDLSTLEPGALLAGLGIRAGQVISSRFEAPNGLSEVNNAISKIAFGYDTEVAVRNSQPWDAIHQARLSILSLNPSLAPLGPTVQYETVRVPGKLRPPPVALRRDVSELEVLISKLVEFVKAREVELVAIFDGLDRLTLVDRFWAVAEQDLRALKSLGISVLIAGPLSAMYGQGRQIRDYFEEIHYLPPVIADPTVSPFMLEVLRRRRAEELMDSNQMRDLCLASGGVLRDLISLARNAIENAYLEDSDHVRTQHVDRSIEQLGVGYLLGLGTRQKELLRSLQDGGGFAPSDSESIELLVTMRVLEQADSRYEVHPALASVLQRQTAREA